jgi:TRAP-type C4-dicarboxylate transport system substrate-binding protein
MHRRTFLKLSSTASLMVAAPYVARADNVPTLKIADSLPSTHYSVPATKFWMARIEELSGGKVKFQHYPAEQLAKAKDLLDSIQNRIADIAYIPAQYFAEKMPLSTVGGLPMPDIKATLYGTSLAFYELGAGILNDTELKDANIRAVRSSATLPYNIHTMRKKVLTSDDLKGQKIRVAGNVQEQSMRALGAVPVSITPPELYNAMQNGTVDGTLFAINSIHSYKLNDMIKYETDNVNLGSFTSYYAINLDVWDSLPKEVHAAFDQAAHELHKFETDLVQKQADEYRAAFTKQGIDIYDIDDAELAKWSKMLEPVREEWVKLYERRRLPARKVLNAWIEALKRNANAKAPA